MSNQQTVRFDRAFAEIHRYEPADGGVGEVHAMLHVADATLTYDEQLAALQSAYAALLGSLGSDVLPVIKRYFLSDAANQANLLLSHEIDDPLGALSVVQQPPLDGTKIALWVYLLRGVKAQAVPGTQLFEATHNGYRHLWAGAYCNKETGSEAQTTIIFNTYILELAAQGCTLSDNCVRTWFYVSDIDNRYAGMVRARNAVFETQGLTDKTHYIASTGIGGIGADPKSFVHMDAYAVAGLQPGQMGYLYAADHLNRTSEYGVRFERGTYVDYGDRRQIFISGTASINDRGQIVHPGDIRRQAERTLENVGALLAEGGAGFDDVAQMVVYLRDHADYAVVQHLFAERFPGKPVVIVYAPVCRPGWLIEVECMAVRAAENPMYKPF
ncbi:MAG: hypothetical protein J6M53_06535 [Bacteroidaceae bacterium]|nr:hypothetical protein [Bacteroidaceae bacterium]